MKKRLSCLMLGMIFAFSIMEDVSCYSVQANTADLYNDGYIIPDSDTRYLTEDAIANMTAQELNYARNEIFARLGREFISQELQNYFNSKSWYVPLYTADEFPNDIMNEYEKYNSQLLYDREHEICPGGYPLDTGSSNAGEAVENSSCWVLPADIELSCTISGEIFSANQYASVDLNGDGEDELIAIGACEKFGENHFAILDNNLQVLKESPDGGYGNAYHCLDVLGNNCLRRTDGNSLVGTDWQWDQYVYFTDGVLTTLEHAYQINRTFAHDGSNNYTESVYVDKFTLNGEIINNSEAQELINELSTTAGISILEENPYTVYPEYEAASVENGGLIIDDGEYASIMAADRQGEALNGLGTTCKCESKDHYFILYGSMNRCEGGSMQNEEEDRIANGIWSFACDENTIYRAVSGESSIRYFTQEEFLNYADDCKDTGLGLVIVMEDGTAVSITIRS